MKEIWRGKMSINIRLNNVNQLLLVESAANTNNAIKFFISYNKGYNQDGSQKDLYIPADLDTEKSNFIASSGDQGNLDSTRQTWNLNHKKNAETKINFYIKELGLNPNSLNKKAELQNQLDKLLSQIKQKQQQQKEIEIQIGGLRFLPNTGIDSKKSSGSLQTQGTGRSVEVSDPNNPDKKAEKLAIHNFDLKNSNEDSNRRQKISELYKIHSELAKEIGEPDKFGLSFEIDQLKRQIFNIHGGLALGTVIDDYLKNRLLKDSAASARAYLDPRSKSNLQLLGKSDGERQQSMRSVADNLAKIYSDYFEIQDVVSRPAAARNPDTIVLPNMSIMTSLVEKTSDLFMKLQKDITNFMEKEERINAKQQLKYAQLDKDIEGKVVGLDTSLSGIEPKYRKNETDSSENKLELPKISTEDMISFTEGIRGKYRNMAKVLDNNMRTMYVKAVESIDVVSQFLSSYGSNWANEGETSNEEVVLKLLELFHKKVLKSKTASTVLQQSTGLFEKYGLKSLPKEDKAIFIRIPEQLNPFEEVQKFIELTGKKISNPDSEESSKVPGQTRVDQRIRNPGLLFVALYKTYLTKEQTIKGYDLPPQSGLHEILKNSKEFLKSDWVDDLTTDLQFNTPLAEANDIRAVIEMTKFLTDSVQTYEPGQTPEENVTGVKLEDRPGTNDYLIKQLKIFEKSGKNYIDFLVTDYKTKQSEYDAQKQKVEKSGDNVSQEDLQKLSQLQAAFKLQKEHIIKVFSPISKDYMIRRYLDTTLIETQNLNYRLINVYNKSIMDYIDSYETVKNQDIKEYLIYRFELFRTNRRLNSGGEIIRMNNGGQKHYYGPALLNHTPKTNAELGSVFETLADLMDVRKARRFDGDRLDVDKIKEPSSDEVVDNKVVSRMDPSGTTFTPTKARKIKMGDKRGSIIGQQHNWSYKKPDGDRLSYKLINNPEYDPDYKERPYIIDKTLDNNGQPRNQYVKNPNYQRIRTQKWIPDPDYRSDDPSKQQKHPVFGKYKIRTATRLQYEAFPSETVLGNPVLLRPKIEAAQKFLLKRFDEEVSKMSKHNSKEMQGSDIKERQVSDSIERLKQKIADLQKQYRDENNAINKKIIETQIWSAEDDLVEQEKIKKEFNIPEKNKKINFSTDTEKSKNQEEVFILELLQMAHSILSVMSITESRLIEEIKSDIGALLDKDSYQYESMINIIKLAYRGDYITIKNLLFKPMNEGEGAARGANNKKSYNEIKPKIITVLKRLIELCIRLATSDEASFKKRIDTAGLSVMGKSYIHVVDNLQKQLLSSLLAHAYKVRPLRRWQDANGGRVTGHKMGGNLNVMGGSSLVDPQMAVLHDQNAQLLRKYSYAYMIQNGNEGDTKGTIHEVMMHVINRYLFRLKEKILNIKAEITDAQQENPVNERKIAFLEEQLKNPHPTDLMKVLGRELDRDIKAAFKNARKQMQFGNTKLSWGFFDKLQSYLQGNTSNIKNASSFERENARMGQLVGSMIINSGYKLDDPLWWEDPELQKEAMNVFLPVIQNKSLASIKRKDELAPKGTRASFRGRSNNFQGDTKKDTLSQLQKDKILQKDIEEFKKQYPQYLEMIQIQTLSLSHKTEDASGEESFELEDLLGEKDMGLGYAESDPLIIEQALRFLQSALDEKCFRPIEDSSIFKDTNSSDNSEDKLKADLTIFNNSLNELRERININPDKCKKTFQNITNQYKNSGKVVEILAYKFFEYLYIKEFILARLLFVQACEVHEKQLDIKEFRSYLNQQIQNGRLEHYPQLIMFTVKEPKNISVNNILDNFFSDDVKKVMNYDTILEIIQQVSNGTDDTSDPIEFKAFAKNSTTQGSVHGGEGTQSSKQEDSNISKKNKEQFGRFKFNNIFSKLKSNIESRTFAISRYYDEKRMLEKLDELDKQIQNINNQLETEPDNKELISKKQKLERQSKFLENRPRSEKDDVLRVNWVQFTNALQALDDISKIKKEELQQMPEYTQMVLQSTVLRNNTLILNYLLTDFQEQTYKSPSGEFLFKHDVYNEAQQEDIIKLLRKIQKIEKNSNQNEGFFTVINKYIPEVITALEKLAIIRTTDARKQAIFIPKELSAKLREWVDLDFDSLAKNLNSDWWKSNIKSTIANGGNNQQKSILNKKLNYLTKAVFDNKDKKSDLVGREDGKGKKESEGLALQNNVREQLLDLANLLDKLIQHKPKSSTEKTKETIKKQPDQDKSSLNLDRKSRPQKEKDDESDIDSKEETNPFSPDSDESLDWEDKKLRTLYRAKYDGSLRSGKSKSKKSQEKNEYIDVSDIINVKESSNNVKETYLLQKILSVVKSEIPRADVIRFKTKEMRTQGDSETQKQNVKKLAGFIMNLSRIKGQDAGEYTIYEPQDFRQYIVTKQDEQSENPKDLIVWMIPKNTITMVHTI